MTILLRHNILITIWWLSLAQLKVLGGLLSDTPSQFIGTSEDWGAGHFPQNYFGIWGTLLLDLVMYTDY